MIKVSNSLPDIAVLRGGKKDFKQSLTEGGEMLTSLTKIGYSPIDVLIDREGEWTLKGKPTDAHEIFTRSHTIIDTTRMKGEAYQELARKMKIVLLFSEAHNVTLDREDLYKILRQQSIPVPDTVVVRANAPLKPSLFRELWSKYHTPLMVRPLKKHDDAPTKLIKLFADLEKTIREYHEKGHDLHVLTYRRVPTASIAVLPNFRNEAMYTPLWVETFTEDGHLPSPHSKVRPHMQAPDLKKENIKDMAERVYDALGLTGPACIDFIAHNNGYVVVNVDLNPSLRKEGRFMQSLATTGVDVGQYVHSCIHNDLER
jgi:D-alanine-D-alanine ligase-like ATP-grasp enzyme